MIRTLQSPWIALVLGAILYLTTTVLFLRPERLAGIHPTLKSAVGGAERSDALVPSWGFKNPELDELVSELRTEREALRTKERELEDYANRLAVERQEITTITQRVASIQMLVDQSVNRIQEQETASLRRLAKVYTTMSPDAAAKILTEFQEEAAVKVLAFMKESQTAPILENMSKVGPAAARKVASISDRLRIMNASGQLPIEKTGAEAAAAPAAPAAAVPPPTPSSPAPPATSPATTTPARTPPDTAKKP